MTNGMVRALASIPDGFMLGPLGAHDAGSITGRSWIAAVAVAVSSGFCKAEMFKSNEETFFLTWKLVSWIIAGVGVSDSSDEQLESLSSNDFSVIASPLNKSDQFNAVWGALPVYLPYKNDCRNAAAALKQLALGVEDSFRSSAASNAVFVNNDKKPLTCTLMSSALFQAMTTIAGNVQTAKLYTWHSFRSYLATALYAAGVKPATIHAMLRWQTEESLRAYMRLSRTEAAKHLEGAANAVVTSVNSANVPLYEEFQLFVAMQRMVDGI
jgi:hypothetical protein